MITSERSKLEVLRDPGYGLGRAKGGNVWHIWPRRTSTTDIKYQKSLCGFQPRRYIAGIGNQWSNSWLNRYRLCAACEREWNRSHQD